MLALDIGVRPAARALGLSEARVMKWSERGKWQIGLLRPRGFNGDTQGATLSAQVSDAIEAKKRILKHHSDRTLLGFAQAATTVAEGLSEKTVGQLIAPGTAISAGQWAKVSDSVHGWQAERTAAPVVQIANVVLPSEDERADRRAMHARLDDIARRLKA